MRIRAALLLLMLLALSAGCADSTDNSSSSAAPGGGAAGGMGTNPNPPGGSSMPSMSTSGSSTPGGTGTGGTAEVDLLDNTFAPLELNITTGTNVTFVNEGTRTHTVTIHHVGDDMATWVKDTTITSGQSTQYTFAAGGTYHVWCRFHGSMMAGMHMVVNVVNNA